MRRAQWWMGGLTHISLFGPQNNHAFVFCNRRLLWFKTQKKGRSVSSALQWVGTGKEKKSGLTKENICIKWKAHEKIFNYVPDWVKYFSASACQPPPEAVPNGQLPGLRETPGNITSEWCHLPLFSQIHGQWIPPMLVLLPLLLHSALLCVPDNGAQILPKGSWLPGSNDLRGYFVTTRV